MSARYSVDQEQDSDFFEVFLALGLVTAILSLGYCVFILNLSDLSRLAQTLGFLFVPIGIATVVTFGGHEGAHWYVAEFYCSYDVVEYEMGERILTSNLTWVGLFVVALIVDLHLVSLPPLVAFGLIVAIGSIINDTLVVSPGGVLIGGRTHKKFCDASAALAGPLWNGIVGIGLWIFLSRGKPVPVLSSLPLTNMEAVLQATMMLSLWIAAYNSLPYGPLDGHDVWLEGNAKHRFALFVVLTSSTFALLSLLGKPPVN